MLSSSNFISSDTLSSKFAINHSDVMQHLSFHRNDYMRHVANNHFDIMQHVLYHHNDYMRHVAINHCDVMQTRLVSSQ